MKHVPLGLKSQQYDNEKFISRVHKHRCRKLLTASTGAQNDLERATAIARSMVTEYGMSSKLGPLYYAKEKRGVFVGLDFSGEPHSERVASEIDEEVRTIVEASYQEVTSLLTDKKPKLETLAQMLLEKEMAEGAELEALLNGKVPEAPAQQPA